MSRSVDGGIVIGASQPKGYNREDVLRYQRQRYGQTIRDISMVNIRNNLCSAGPGMCESCRLCEYGKEYLRRTTEEKE